VKDGDSLGQGDGGVTTKTYFDRDKICKAFGAGRVSISRTMQLDGRVTIEVEGFTTWFQAVCVDEDGTEQEGHEFHWDGLWA